MKVNVEFELEESMVMRAIVKKFISDEGLDKDEEVNCIYGSAGQTIHEDNTIGIHYELDRRIIPGVYGILEKHETAIQGIIMMVGGLVQTVKVATKSIADDTKKFFEDFEAQKKEEAAHKNNAVAEDHADASVFQQDDASEDITQEE